MSISRAKGLNNTFKPQIMKYFSPNDSYAVKSESMTQAGQEECVVT